MTPSRSFTKTGSGQLCGSVLKDDVRFCRHTLEWVELVRRCGHAQKRSGHNLNAYAGSKPISLQLTVLDLQLPPPPPRLSPPRMKRQQEQGQREEDIDASGAAPARESQDVQEEGASGGEAVGERAEATRGADATQGSVSNAATDATSSLAAAAAGTGKTEEMQQGEGEGEGKGEEEEDNVARVLRLGAQPDGVDAEDAAWIATIIEQALELLDHAGARAALSAIRSTLTAGHGDYVRLVCGSKASSGGGGGGGGASDSEGKEGKGDTDAVAAVAAAAAEQLGGATASRRGRGRPRGSSSSSSRAAGGRKDKDEEVYYPAGCVVDGDTGVLLST
jgi:hypothetical protein